MVWCNREEGVSSIYLRVNTKRRFIKNGNIFEKRTLMEMQDIFSGEELGLVRLAFSPRNGNMVFGLAFRLDFMDRSGFLEDSRAHFAQQFRTEFPKIVLAEDYLKRELSGKKIIELGPGFVGNKLDHARFFAALGASSYVGVEPTITQEKKKSWTPPITFLPRYAPDRQRVTLEIPYALVAQDGLSYLLTQPDDSAVIFSSCVFRYDVLGSTGLPEELESKYLKELVKQMQRVTPEGAISIHADNTFPDELFEEAGFTVELCGTGKRPGMNDIKITEQSELQYLLGRGGLVLRKK